MAGIKHKNCLLTIFPSWSLCMTKKGEKRKAESRNKNKNKKQKQKQKTKQKNAQSPKIDLI